MELRHLRYFLTVAEEKNITRAAERLCIAQPPLSRQIKDLEDELGTQLFLRNTRSMELTQAGHLFAQYAQQILHLSEQSVENIREMNHGLRGTLYLASVEGMAPRLISGWISAFHQKYPHVDFNLWNGNTDDVSERLNSHLCDIAVIVGPYDPELYNGFCVHEEPWVAMIPKNHPLGDSASDTITLSELAPYELIIPSRQLRLQEITDWFSDFGIRPNIVCRLAHMVNACELVAQGTGIAIYPAAVSEYGNTAAITAKKIIQPEHTATYLMVRCSGRPLSMVAEEFWKFVQNSLISD